MNRQLAIYREKLWTVSQCERDMHSKGFINSTSKTTYASITRIHTQGMVSISRWAWVFRDLSCHACSFVFEAQFWMGMRVDLQCTGLVFTKNRDTDHGNARCIPKPCVITNHISHVKLSFRTYPAIIWQLRLFHSHVGAFSMMAISRGTA